MFLLSRVLSPEQLTSIRHTLSLATFKDGRVTAAGITAAVKHNTQLHRTGAQTEEILDHTIVNALNAHELFSAALMPKNYAIPLFSRYEPGMRYGAHVDSAFMGAEQKFRMDVSVTIFLNEPDQYEGGELAIEEPGGMVRQVKLNAGDGVAYPTFAIHQVNPVTAGQRLVAVTWAQSMIRDPRIREVIFDLHRVNNSLLQDQPGGANVLLVQKSLANMTRIFGE